MVIHWHWQETYLGASMWHVCYCDRYRHGIYGQMETIGCGFGSWNLSGDGCGISSIMLDMGGGQEGREDQILYFLDYHIVHGGTHLTPGIIDPCPFEASVYANSLPVAFSPQPRYPILSQSNLTYDGWYRFFSGFIITLSCFEP